jgi:predicted transcriptional regulator YdeE
MAMTGRRSRAIALGMLLAICLAGGCSMSAKVTGEAREASRQRGGHPMEPAVVEKHGFRIVGLEMADAGARAPLIMQLWVALAPKAHLIRDQVEPHVLYGVWWRRPGATGPSYVVGFRVRSGATVPAGMVAVEVPPSRYVMLAHKGSLGHVSASYERIMQWGREQGVQWGGRGVTHEVYDTSQPISDDYTVPVYEPIE